MIERKQSLDARPRALSQETSVRARPAARCNGGPRRGCGCCEYDAARSQGGAIRTSRRPGACAGRSAADHSVAAGARSARAWQEGCAARKAPRPLPRNHVAGTGRAGRTHRPWPDRAGRAARRPRCDRWRSITGMAARRFRSAVRRRHQLRPLSDQFARRSGVCVAPCRRVRTDRRGSGTRRQGVADARPASGPAEACGD